MRNHLYQTQTNAKEREELVQENNKYREKVKELEAQAELDKNCINKLQEEIVCLGNEKEAFELLAASPSELNKNDQGNEKILIVS